MLVHSGSEQYWEKWCQYLNTLFLKIQPHLLRTMTFLKKDWEQNVLVFFLTFIREIKLKIMFFVHQYICCAICTQSPKSEDSIKEIELLQDSWIAEKQDWCWHCGEASLWAQETPLVFFFACLLGSQCRDGCETASRGASMTKGKDCWGGLWDSEGPKKKN